MKGKSITSCPLSTTQTKYISLVEGVKETIWLNEMIVEFEITPECVNINCDS